MQVLVIARIVAGTAREKILPLIKPEAAKVWEYVAADLVRTVHYIADHSGAVLLFEATSVEAVNEAIAQLPMVQAGVLQCEVLPLVPFTGLKELFAD
ncbi:hypothetical protein [Mastigocladopsis repens]|uniref:hypothetical protein n=1 Tax=Mastigocladopsis repens TaxID=221287 RepID=UPI0002F83460|nr:hypothetical protein [Mastigocladopsis repens]